MKAQRIEYQHGSDLLEGYLAYDNASSEKRPAVLIVHDWTGRNDFACEKAEALAQMGYVGFALDMYGKDKLGKNNDEKTQLMTPLVNDRALLQSRMNAALDVLRAQKMVDASNVVVIGFCFGGLCALDLARSGADIKGVVSFHGLLNAPEDIENKPIKAKVLALHGHDDPMVPPEQVAAFQKEMTDAEVNWQMHIYGKTMHAFMNPQANDPDFGTVYRPNVANRAWLAMQNFFSEIFI